MLTQGKLDFMEKGSQFPEKCWFVTGIWLTYKSKEYTNVHRPNAPIICAF